jgi:parallel beta-helix repeat protein
MKKLLGGIFLPIALSAGQSLAATYTVTNLNDSGSGSLRAAIQSANGDPGSTVEFSAAGTINLASPLPEITATTTISGTTAPGYAGSPVVAVNFAGNPGFAVAKGADASAISGLSLVGAGNAGVTLRASRVKVAGNYIGLLPNGSVSGNFGDGIRILAVSGNNLIGNFNPVESIDYYDTSDSGAFTVQPVTGWQGIRNSGTNAGEFLICGTSGTNGLIYDGPIDGGGDSYTVVYPGSTTIATSVYGPDNPISGGVRLVGSYRKTGTTEYNFGFVWEGTLDQLPSGGTFRTISYPGATYQFTHSTMGRLAVGNADGPALDGKIPLGAGKAYIYDLETNTFVTNIVFPKSKSNTAYGIWQNGPTTYTICGGYSPNVTSNLQTPGVPLTQGKGFLVDYDFHTGKFSNWTSFDYPNGPVGVDFITHFEGISSAEPGVYTLSADSVQAGSANPVQGSWVSVRRNSDGTFDKGVWVDLNYPNSDGVASSNSVYGNYVVGISIGSDTFSYQAVINSDFQLSNVIAGNHANGIAVMGSNDNVIAMNYIGTDPAGTASGFGNGSNGVFVSNGAARNLIGGVAFGVNNPTGSKNPANAVFQRPIQGNLISGNYGHGVLINANSTDNVLSGNYIGTVATGTAALANGGDGVMVEDANRTQFLGCTLYQNPFVYYNVISGNRGHGVRVRNSNNVVVQANFLGMGSDNATSVPNGGNGLLLEGNSRNPQVGGVIPLGNVISGNTFNGIEVTDRVSGFISFNTFGGIAAFQQFPSPNGQNGILITSAGGNNTIRTCIISGNLGNGIELSGNAKGVQITDTSVGTTTTITGTIPNQGSGIVIRGKANGNAIGGFQPSVEPTCFISGNKKYGIVISEGAYNNSIFHSNIGIGAANSGAMPNDEGGILLDRGSRNTTIGGRKTPFQNTIQSNGKAGLYINISRQNTILNNIVTENSEVGIYAFGPCNGTTIKGNTVTDNGSGGTNNVDLTNSKGIIFVP